MKTKSVMNIFKRFLFSEVQLKQADLVSGGYIESEGEDFMVGSPLYVVNEGEPLLVTEASEFETVDGYIIKTDESGLISEVIEKPEAEDEGKVEIEIEAAKEEVKPEAVEETKMELAPLEEKIATLEAQVASLMAKLDEMMGAQSEEMKKMKEKMAALELKPAAEKFSSLKKNEDKVYTSSAMRKLDILSKVTE